MLVMINVLSWHENESIVYWLSLSKHFLYKHIFGAVAAVVQILINLREGLQRKNLHCDILNWHNLMKLDVWRAALCAIQVKNGKKC